MNPVRSNLFQRYEDQMDRFLFLDMGRGYSLQAALSEVRILQNEWNDMQERNPRGMMVFRMNQIRMFEALVAGEQLDLL